MQIGCGQPQCSPILTIDVIPLLKSSRTASSRSGFIDSDVHSANKFNGLCELMSIPVNEGHQNGVLLLHCAGAVDWLESGNPSTEM